MLATTVSARAESLDEAWQRTLATDNSLEAAASRVAAAESQLAAARAERKPRVTATSTYMRWRDVPAFDFSGAGVPAVLPLFSGDAFTLSMAQVSVPLYSAGLIGANIEAADASLSAQASSHESLIEDLKLAVATRYVGVLRAQSALSIAQANTASLHAHALDVEDMLQAGQVPRNDMLAASVALADAQQRELQAANALELARAGYNRQTGRPLAAAVELDTKLPPVGPELDTRPLDSLIELARAHRVELEGLEAASAGLEARAAATRAQARPQLTASGSYLSLDNQFLDRESYWTIGIGVSWSAFDGGRTRHAAAALGRQAAAALDERAYLDTMIELQVRGAWLDTHETRERVAVTAGAIEQAEENLRVVLDRYRNGEGTNTEVLDAESLRSLARGNYDNARYDAALARLRLARAVGIL